MSAFARLADNVATLAREIEELRRLNENTVRVGVVTQVDAAKGLAKIDIGTDKNRRLPAALFCRLDWPGGASLPSS